jgi:hypothetical protein
MSGALEGLGERHPKAGFLEDVEQAGHRLASNQPGFQLGQVVVSQFLRPARWRLLVSPGGGKQDLGIALDLMLRNGARFYSERPCKARLFKPQHYILFLDGITCEILASYCVGCTVL